MKTLIYQMWDGTITPAVEAGIDNMRNYANTIGAEYRFDDNRHWIKSKGLDLGNYNPHFGAFCPVFEDEFDDYDYIMFADTDVFVVDGMTDNVFSAFAKTGSDIGLVEETFQPLQRTITTGNITSKSDEDWYSAVKTICPEADFPRTSDGLLRVFNSGMVVYSRAGIEKARRLFTPFDKYANAIRKHNCGSFYVSDQPYLHSMIFSKPFKVEIMGGEWNSFIHGTRDMFQPKRRIVDHRTSNTKLVHCQFPGADEMSADQLWRVVNLRREQWGYDLP